MIETKHIEIVPYNPVWPQMFELEAASIRTVLGHHCIAIHHIGSTSVPGLAAKPIVDIIVVVKNTQETIRPLAGLGFEYKGEYNIPMRLFFNRAEGVQANLHIYEDDHPEIELNLCFRDYLRAHIDARDAYAALKKNLVKDPANFHKVISIFTGYTLGKYAFICETLKNAGFKRLRFVKCAHYAELAAAKHFRQKYFADKVPGIDLYANTWDNPEHAHLMLYQGMEIIGYAHIHLYSDEQHAVLLMIMVDEHHQSAQTSFLAMLEKWHKVLGLSYTENML